MSAVCTLQSASVNDSYLCLTISNFLSVVVVSAALSLMSCHVCFAADKCLLNLRAAATAAIARVPVMLASVGV